MRSPASTHPGNFLKTDASRAPPLCIDARALRVSLPLFTDGQQSVTHLSQEHDDQALTDPAPVARIIAWQSFAASTHEFHPTGGTPHVRSLHRRHQGYVYYILVAAFPDSKKNTALQVGLQLA